MSQHDEQHGAERIGPHEETVVIRRPELKESRGLMTALKDNWRSVSDAVSQRSDQFKSWLSGFRRVEEMAPNTAKKIHDETTQILQPTADVVRARKEVVFPSTEEVKTLEETKRKEQAMKDIAEAAGIIELQESDGISVETFTDSAGYRFKENPTERENQDYVATTEHGSVIVDGMGGLANGREAAMVIGEEFMIGLKTIKTHDEKKFKAAMQVSGNSAQERMKAFAGKEITGGAMLATKVLETLPNGSKKVGVAWSGDVWAGVITPDGKADKKRETIDHSALNDIYEIRAETNSTKREALIERFAETIANNDNSPNMSFEQKKSASISLIKNWVSKSEDEVGKLAPKLRMMMTHSINNQEKELKIDTKVWTLAPGESLITLTDGYTDVLKLPQDIERSIKIAQQNNRPVMQVLTELYLEALNKGGVKEDNIGGTFMTVEIPELSANELEEEQDEWAEKTNPDFRIPTEGAFYDEHTQYGIKLPNTK